MIRNLVCSCVAVVPCAGFDVYSVLQLTRETNIDAAKTARKVADIFQREKKIQQLEEKNAQFYEQIQNSIGAVNLDGLEGVGHFHRIISETWEKARQEALQQIPARVNKLKPNENMTRAMLTKSNQTIRMLLEKVEGLSDELRHMHAVGAILVADAHSNLPGSLLSIFNDLKPVLDKKSKDNAAHMTAVDGAADLQKHNEKLWSRSAALLQTAMQNPDVHEIDASNFQTKDQIQQGLDGGGEPLFSRRPSYLDLLGPSPEEPGPQGLDGGGEPLFKKRPSYLDLLGPSREEPGPQKLEDLIEEQGEDDDEDEEEEQPRRLMRKLSDFKNVPDDMKELAETRKTLREKLATPPQKKPAYIDPSIDTIYSTHEGVISFTFKFETRTGLSVEFQFDFTYEGLPGQSSDFFTLPMGINFCTQDYTFETHFVMPLVDLRNQETARLEENELNPKSGFKFKWKNHPGYFDMEDGTLPDGRYEFQVEVSGGPGQAFLLGPPNTPSTPLLNLEPLQPFFKFTMFEPQQLQVGVTSNVGLGYPYSQNTAMRDSTFQASVEWCWWKTNESQTFQGYEWGFAESFKLHSIGATYFQKWNPALNWFAFVWPPGPPLVGPKQYLVDRYAELEKLWIIQHTKMVEDEVRTETDKYLREKWGDDAKDSDEANDFIKKLDSYERNVLRVKKHDQDVLNDLTAEVADSQEVDNQGTD